MPTVDLLRAGEPVWLWNYRTGREDKCRVVIDLGNSIVVCSESDYLLANADSAVRLPRGAIDCPALVGKAYPRGDVRPRE